MLQQNSIPRATLNHPTLLLPATPQAALNLLNRQSSALRALYVDFAKATLHCQRFAGEQFYLAQQIDKVNAGLSRQSALLKELNGSKLTLGRGNFNLDLASLNLDLSINTSLTTRQRIEINNRTSLECPCDEGESIDVRPDLDRINNELVRQTALLRELTRLKPAPCPEISLKIAVTTQQRLQVSNGQIIDSLQPVNAQPAPSLGAKDLAPEPGLLRRIWVNFSGQVGEGAMGLLAKKLGAGERGQQWSEQAGKQVFQHGANKIADWLSPQPAQIKADNRPLAVVQGAAEADNPLKSLFVEGSREYGAEKGRQLFESVGRGMTGTKGRIARYLLGNLGEAIGGETFAWGAEKIANWFTPDEPPPTQPIEPAQYQPNQYAMQQSYIDVLTTTTATMEISRDGLIESSSQIASSISLSQLSAISAAEQYQAQPALAVPPLAIEQPQDPGLFESILGEVGSVAGGRLGMMGGAAIGSLILPGVGTVIGGALGAFAGSSAGEWLLGSIGRFFDGEPEPVTPLGNLQNSQQTRGMNRGGGRSGGGGSRSIWQPDNGDIGILSANDNSHIAQLQSQLALESHSQIGLTKTNHPLTPNNLDDYRINGDISGSSLAKAILCGELEVKAAPRLTAAPVSLEPKQSTDLLTLSERDHPLLSNSQISAPDSRLIEEPPRSNSDNRQIIFSPVITIHSQCDTASDPQTLADLLLERLKSELLPMLASNDLAVRLDGALYDGATV